jgi:hypothetical protein
LLVRNTRKVEHHINTLEQPFPRHGPGKIYCSGRGTVRKGCARFAQGRDRVAAREQLLAKVAPDIAGSSGNKTFHSVGPPLKKGKGAKAPS